MYHIGFIVVTVKANFQGSGDFMHENIIFFKMLNCTISKLNCIIYKKIN